MKERVKVADVRWKRVPELGSRATESSVPRAAETMGLNREVEGGGRSEAARQGGNAEEIRKVGAGEVVNGLKSVQENFIIDAEFDRGLVKLLEDGGNVVKGQGSGNNTGCRVLD